MEKGSGAVATPPAPIVTPDDDDDAAAAAAAALRIRRGPASPLLWLPWLPRLSLLPYSSAAASCCCRCAWWLRPCPCPYPCPCCFGESDDAAGPWCACGLGGLRGEAAAGSGSVLSVCEKVF